MEDRYCSYYTKSDFIINYMIKMLEFNKNCLVLEPSCGDGVFVDALINIEPNAKIDAYDLNDESIKILKKKYNKKSNINVFMSDTLMDKRLDEYAINKGHYDRVIGNPPWGAWQDYDKRRELKQKYNDHYVKETYSVFLLRCISLLKDKGILSFIIPDTFLFLHRHKKLRKFILTNCNIREIIIFPSKFFPGVQFGYSNICVITLQKSNIKKALSNSVRIIKGFKRERDLEDITLNKNLDKYIVKKLNQRDIYNTLDSSFFINEKDKISNIINNAQIKLGDISYCVTGIYCGNNKRFMRVDSKQVKGSKNYEIINEEEICNCKALEGVEDIYRKYIPIVKGNSNSKYLRRKNNWYINWSKEAIKHYNTDKKARFQNSQFYFKKGIALPMVKSSKIAATIIEEMIFDQSVVGVFPIKDKYLNYLLGLLNSDIVRNIIQTINPTANNSANYIKKIPIILPHDNKDLIYIDNLVNIIIEDMKLGKIEEAHNKQKKVNQFFMNLYF